MDLEEPKVNKRKTKIHFSIKNPKDKNNLSNTAQSPKTKRKRKNSYSLKTKSLKNKKSQIRKVKKKTPFQQKTRAKLIIQSTVPKRKKTGLKRNRTLSLKKNNGKTAKTSLNCFGEDLGNLDKKNDPNFVILA